MKRILAFILAVFMLAILFVSCKEEPNKTEEPVSQEDEILTSDLKNYSIVYCSDSGKELKNKIDELAAKFYSLYKVNLKTVLDIKQETTDKEILIGYTNRTESQSFLNNMRSKDYGYCLLGSKIIIAGHSDEYTIKALETFFLTVINEKTESIKIPEPNIMKAQYDADDLKINGVSVRGWVVVYPQNYKNSEKDYAGQISAALSDVSGYPVRLCSDKENVTEKAIIVKMSENTGISVSDSVITLSAKDQVDMAQICTTVVNVFANAQVNNRIIDVKIENGMKLEEFVTVMSFNLRYDLTENQGLARAYAVVAQIRDYAPDVFGVQEDSTQWCDILDAELTEYTAVRYSNPVSKSADSQEWLTIYYRTAKFNLVKSGTKWLSNTPNIPNSKYSESSIIRGMNYAVLEQISDGKRFCFVNTHLEHTASEAVAEARMIARKKQTAVLIEETKKLCEKYEDIPSVIVGDFNATNTESIHATMREQGYNDCRLDAISVKSQGTWNQGYYGDSVNTQSSILDYCYVSEKDFIICSYTVSSDKYNDMYTSDHFPVIVKLLFVK